MMLMQLAHAITLHTACTIVCRFFNCVTVHRVPCCSAARNSLLSLTCLQDLLPLHTLRHDPACSSLANDYTVRIARADYLYRQADTVAAYRHCRSIVQDDPRALECMPVYLACMVQLGKKNELFQLGHQYALITPANA